jgi:hypothetical protein
MGGGWCFRVPVFRLRGVGGVQLLLGWRGRVSGPNLHGDSGGFHPETISNGNEGDIPVLVGRMVF